MKQDSEQAKGSKNFECKIFPTEEVDESMKYNPSSGGEIKKNALRMIEE